jgi:putative transposase
LKKDRVSIRLPEYDYSAIGEYFITICAKEREHRLGIIENDEMKPNVEGNLVTHWINEIPNYFDGVKVEHFIVMPNHIHLIVEIFNSNNTSNYIDLEDDRGNYKNWRIARSKMTLSKVISYFKSNSARAINKLNNVTGISFWQSNYYEHIIRNEKEYKNISNYISNNPINWKEDRFNK